MSSVARFALLERNEGSSFRGRSDSRLGSEGRWLMRLSTRLLAPVRLTAALANSALWMLLLTSSAPVGAVQLQVPAAADWIPGADWQTYNKTLDGQRYSPLTQITSRNAISLAQVCRVQVADNGAFEPGLIVIGNTMYATTATDTLALDPVTCGVKWRHVYHRSQLPTNAVNRGVAYFNGRLFRGTDDGRLIALDAQTGAELWTDVVGDARLGEELSQSPVAWNGLVIIGTAVGELGIRGRIMAFDAETGREVWRFHTIPVGDEPGAETWKNTRWNEHGGGGIWSTMTVDPVANEVFVSVGNPMPAFTPSDRPGSNLYANCVVVLDAITGRLKWWYQQNALDAADHDLVAAPLLYRDANNQERVALAGKDGYLHIVDRQAHSLVAKTAVTTVDATPQVPGDTPIRVCPGIAGGVAWNGPALDPIRQLLYVGAIDFCTLVRSEKGAAVNPGGSNYGGTWAPTAEPTSGWITALDATSGQIKWKFHAPAPVVSGITPTAGGVVFAGDNAGNLYVFDSGSGSVLKTISTGGSMSGGVITYQQRGKQYVAVTSGNASRSVFGVSGRPTIIVLALPDRADAGKQHAGAADPVRGMQLYYASCAICHGADGRNVAGFDLTTVKQRMTVAQLMSWIENPRPPMPGMFPVPSTPAEELAVRDIATFLHQWPAAPGAAPGHVHPDR